MQDFQRGGAFQNDFSLPFDDKGGTLLIRRNQLFLNRINVLLDFLVVVASYVLATWFWLDVMGGRSDNMAALSGRTLLLSCLYAIALLLTLAASGLYTTTRTKKLSWKLERIFLSTSVAILVASTLLFIFRLVEFSRGVLFSFYLFTLVLLSGKYIFLRLVFRQMRAHGFNLKHVLVLGTGKSAMQYEQDTLNEVGLGIHVKGFIGKENPHLSNYLGGFDQLDQQLAALDINEAVIALDHDEYSHIRELIAACEKNGVKYYIIPFYYDVIPAHPIIETVGSSKLIAMRANRLENVGWAMIKRGFDMIASGLGLIILSPLLACIAIGVKLSSPGPILFKQQRVGYERRAFNMLKFRSMRVNDEENTAWSTITDNRRTGFGSLIRKTSLDELPQLWNVFKGDMSLVGPRPELPRFVNEFKETVPFYMVKHQVRPGMTGWAQINGYRGDTSIVKRVELDLWYIDNWSAWLDIKILFKTVFGGMMNKEKLYAAQEMKEKQGKQS